MSKEKKNDRKKMKELYKLDRTANSLERIVRKFHRTHLKDYGKKTLTRNLDRYQHLLIRYAVLYSRAFCKPLDLGMVSAIIAEILIELETE